MKCFYAQSLERTRDKRHARLNTQRKILEVLWTCGDEERMMRSASTRHSHRAHHARLTMN